MASTLFLLSVLWFQLPGLRFLQAAGGTSETFSFVNSGDVRGYDMEYDANYRTLPLTSPNGIFQMTFFNTTPNAYALGIAMGYSGQGETKRIVWTANRNDLVRESAILKYGTDGNLLLSNADGRVVWSTNTYSKGVVGMELQNNGNLVLHDKLKKPVWQSFDHATDSLLVGQSLNIGGVKKLVSRASEKDGSEGPYSLAIEAGGLALYASIPEPVPLWTLSFYQRGPRDIYSITHTCKKPVSQATFLIDPQSNNGFRQMIEMRLANFTAAPEFRALELCNLTSEEANTTLYGFNTPRFNTTLSFLRLEHGDLKMYTYLPDMESNKWDTTYQRFGCWRGVPEFGGSMVVSRRCQCVACAQADGYKGSGSEGSCALPSLADSKDTSSSNSSVDFYKLAGPEHFVNANPSGETETEECRRKCSHDCYTCAAFLHWEQSSACLHTATVGTPNNQLGNSANLVFIKTVNKG